MQFGYKDFRTSGHDEIVVDCKSVDPLRYKSVIERQNLIGHNLKFDLQFLYNYGIVPLSVYDTMVCEQTLYLGYKPGSVSMRLSDVLFRHTGTELDKSFQKQIAAKGLTKDGIVYAAHDVVHLQDIRRAQVTIAKYRNCVNAFTVENRFVPAIAYLEWCGVHLDEGKWKEKMSKDRQEMDECRKKLDEYVINHTLLRSKFTSSYTQLSLFGDEDVSSPCTVNWDSASQVIPVAQALGFSTSTLDKKTKREKDSVDEKQLSVQKGIDDQFLKLYFDYKGAVKNVTSNGQTHLNLINPNLARDVLFSYIFLPI